MILALFIAFQNCSGGVALMRESHYGSSGTSTTIATSTTIPLPTTTLVPTTTTIPVDYKYLAKGTSTFAQPERTGVFFVDLNIKSFQFYDLGPQWSGNAPFSSVVYNDSTKVRVAVTQPISLKTNPEQGSVYLVEINKNTMQKTVLLQETQNKDRWSYFLRPWVDCDGDGIKDWIQTYGSNWDEGFRCRSAITGAIIQSKVNPDTRFLYRALNRDMDGDGVPEFLMEGAGFIILGSKNNEKLVSWTVPSTAPGWFVHYPDYFDIDRDGWNEVIIRSTDVASGGSYYIYSMKLNKALAEIKIPVGINPNDFWLNGSGSFFPGTAYQLIFSIPQGMIFYNTDGTEAGRFMQEDFFTAFSALSPKPSCWTNCRNATGFATPTEDLDKDGYQELVILHPDYFFYYSPKNKTGLLSHPVSVGTYVNNYFEKIFMLP